LCERFPTADQLATARSLQNQHTGAYRDGEVPLAEGLWVHSGSEPEGLTAEEFFESQSNAGECPVMRIELAGLASSRLWRILQDKAQGLGWLLRANAVDEQSTESLK
jgi:hypothetical protein